MKVHDFVNFMKSVQPTATISGLCYH